jgi:F420-non-reducing hydrogenase iron-sulfur subunit
MNKPEKEIVIFYCTHQGEGVTQVLKGLNGLEKLRVRKVALPCSGKLEVFQLTRALEGGADGVALFGCPEGECRYVVGSSRAKGRVSYAGKILEMIGLEKERVRRFVLESGIQPETIEAISAWLETVNALGPVPKIPKSEREDG